MQEFILSLGLILSIIISFAIILMVVIILIFFFIDRIEREKPQVLKIDTNDWIEKETEKKIFSGKPDANGNIKRRMTNDEIEELKQTNSIPNITIRKIS